MTWKLVPRGSTPRPLDSYDPDEHRELKRVLRAVLAPYNEDVVHALVHGRPALHEGAVDVAALAAAGIDAVETTRATLAPNGETPRVRAAVNALVEALEAQAPENAPYFAGPAWAVHVQLLEATIGRSLPESLAAWLGLHDGTEPGALDLGRWRIDAAEKIESTWAFLDSMDAVDLEVHPDAGVRPVWWNRSWIPFANDGAGNHLCIDLDPAPGGTVGQVIEYVHDGPVRPREAESLVAWFDATTAALQGGGLVVGEDDAGRAVSLLEPEALTGSLATTRVRGESTEARSERLRQVLSADGLGSVVADALRRRGRQITFAPGFDPMHLVVMAGDALRHKLLLATRLERFVVDVRASRFVERFDVTAEELLADVEAWLES